MPLQICKHWACKTKGIKEGTVISEFIWFFFNMLVRDIETWRFGDNMLPLSNADSYMFGSALNRYKSVKSALE